MTDRIALEFICGLGMRPNRFVELAAELGCKQVGLACAPVVLVPELHAPWSLKDDAVLRREVAAALSANGVSISLGEGFLIRPGSDVLAQRDELAILAELGATRVNVVSIESDWQRNCDQFAAFAASAGEHGCSATLEFMPGMPIGSAAIAAELITASGAQNAGVLIDAMHFFRSGATVGDLIELDPAHVGYAQICDVPEVPAIADYGTEARFERLPPGDGELPLENWLAALPNECVVGLELPMRSKALAGYGLADLLRPAVARLRARLG